MAFLAGGEHSLVVVDLNGDAIRSVGPVADPPIAGLSPGLRVSLTPDRSALTYSVNRTTQHLWLMEGLDKIELP